MQKLLCATFALGGLLVTGSDVVVAQTTSVDPGTIVLNGASGASCTYSAINVQPNGGISVTCSSVAVTVPGKPSSITATPYDAKIDVSYSAAAANGGVIDQYEAQCESTEDSISKIGAGASTSIQLTEAVNGRAYTCRVRAHNSAGYGEFSDPSAPVTPQAGLDPTRPPKPATPTATAGSGKIVLAFAAPANGGSAIIKIQANCTSGDGGVEGSAETANGSATTLTVNGLTPGSTYACRIRAQNSLGIGDYSDSSANVTVGATSGCGPLPAGVTVGEWTTYALAGMPLKVPTTGTGSSMAYGFTANQTYYKAGSQITIESTTNTGGDLDAEIAITSCPGVFESPQTKCALTSIKIGTMKTTFDPLDTRACQLVNGQNYYLNVRPAAGVAYTSKLISSQKR